MEGWDASAAAEMFSSVDKLFIKHGISWDFVTALGVNNTNANIGEHNSLKSRVLDKKHNILFLDAHAIFFITLLVNLVQYLQLLLVLTLRIIV